ncbi:MAG TPA: hypothetical protein VGY32_02205, partial [Solirubrobacteraceae bacterium]|nr:hypothetical protein [Solirubrobacteraceae bacterium]
MALSFVHTVSWRATVAAISAAGGLAVATGSASAALPNVPPGFSVKQFAVGSSTTSKPDDIVRLDGHLFVAWQNGVGPQGEPGPNGTTSTVIEYDDAGHVLNQLAPTGRVDGLGADRAKHVVYLTVNEDANSSFYVLDPGAPAGSQLRHLTYNDPGGAISGGTDAVSVDPRGNVYLSASNPAAVDSNAVALAKVDSPSVGQVTVSKTFADNSGPVRDGNHPGSTTTLALTDPDSNALVPEASPRFAHDFVLDSQGDGKL